MKVIFWARSGLAKAQLIARLQAVEGVQLVVAETLPQVLEALPGAQGLVTPDAPVAEARQILQTLQQPGALLRWVHFITAGREGFEEVGIPPQLAVTWAAGGVSPTVAEHAMALLLALTRRIPDMGTQKAARVWDRSLGGPLQSLEGAKLLIVGLGHIGRELARRATAFGMRVQAVTRTPRPDPLVESVHGMDRLDELLPRADAIVLAAALTPETAGLVNQRTLALCKRTALIVNVARGGLVDQPALHAALAAGRIGGAALDVTSPEPLPADDPLWSCPNLIISPHVAGGGSLASLERLATGAAENARRLLAGEALLNQVQ
ncbi:D-2-hydroxyacid dehydrogenase [Ramlibacter sp. AW1]|uniref:D-2-hydroxyacid dehydrogenase n=1 Tax=Ramlibacter aurantiacus TaxID=2801330 RepID=A0A937D3R2_9BURK|nr:D-2-hydroxyacid dehydrogenase [Ramlibacter aurantiacus]MBL0422974.1 D-2-hydroxyacid dehydrogenase [Ramlibacter aurantiacus]